MQEKRKRLKTKYPNKSDQSTNGTQCKSIIVSMNLIWNTFDAILKIEAERVNFVKIIDYISFVLECHARLILILRNKH